jgi:hypothetical protein
MEPQIIGCMLGYRKHWDACNAEERAALVAGENAVLERARRFNEGKSRNGYGKGWSRRACLRNANQ